MDKSPAKNDMKRPNGNDTSSSQKRQRTSGSTDETQPKSQEEPKKIIDLDDGCLEKIFDHLDLHSLFSVAVSNEWLRPAANIVYHRKFNNKVINIHTINIHPNPHANIKDFFWICFEKVSFSDFIICLQFLRCFGSSLSNVHIYYHGSDSKRYDYIHQYVNQFCAESLLEIEFTIKPRLLINHFEKPFVNVQTVALHYCHLGDQFSLFSQWFPNVRVLKLFDIRMDNRWIDLPFHHLEHVRINVSNGNNCDGFTKNEAAHLLHSSLQLKSLEIRMPDGRQGMTLNTLLNIIEDKSAIEKLVLTMDRYCPTVKPMEIQRLINEHPLLIELDLKNVRFTIDNVLDLICRLNFLKTFFFQLNCPLEYTHCASRFNSDQWQTIFHTQVWNRNMFHVELKRSN